MINHIKDVCFTNRFEAQAVIDKLRSYIETYTVVSVYDYNKEIHSGSTFLDDRFGWTDLSSARIIELPVISNEKIDMTVSIYKVELPDPKPIN